MTISLNINQIKRYLPHRYPFLFIDSVEEVVPGEHIRGKKAVTGNEDFFNGHFPGNPVVPGVIQIEAMGQCGALLAILSGAEVDAEKQIYVATIDRCRFRRPIVPGEVMELRARIVRRRMGTWKLQCEVHVDGKLASEALVSASGAPRASNPALPSGLPPGMFSED